MVVSAFFVFKLLVLLHYGNCQFDLNVGDPCIIKSSNRNGVCSLLSLCIQAIEGLRRNIHPQICGFQGTESIVCCAQSNGVATTTTSTSTTTSRTTTRTTTRATIRSATRPPQTFTGYGAKSRQKCVEYQQYVYEEEFSGVFVGGAQTRRVDRCALVFIENIVGGTEAKPREFPHMALIGFNAKNNQILWQCGGTLISDEFVITAAHCLYEQWGKPRYVRIGELRLDTNRDDAQVQDFTIVEWIEHPDYIPPSKYNDIALLRLNNKVRLNSYARPACLHTTLNIPVRKAAASGWGKVGYTADVSKHLFTVTLEFFSNSDCNRTYDIGVRLRNGIVESMQVCAGHYTEAKDTCRGDSGGPLQIINPDPNIYCMYSLVGITSFGKACGVANIPGVYTRVSNYIDWIEKIVWP